jgi:membrane protease YdiL (CAAX protease family)
MPTRLTTADRKLIACALVVAALSFVISQRYFRRTFPEASLELRVNRADSESIARNFLLSRGLRLEQYRHTAIFTYNDFTKLYLERTFGLDRLNRLTAGPVHLWRWTNRWFRPQQEEEFRVDVTPTGEVVGLSHIIPEKQAGKDLDPAAARAIAESFLIQTMKRDLGDLELLESQANKRPARTDHTFTWKQKRVDLGEASLRVSVSVDGDLVSGYSEFVYVPEKWTRDYERMRSRNQSAQAVDEALFSLLSIAMVVTLILRLRDRDVPVRTASGFGLVGGMLYFLSQVNNFPLAESGYGTTDSYSSFVTSYFTSTAVSALGVATMIFFLVAAAEPEYRQGFPRLISLRRYFSWRGSRTKSFFLANVVGLTLAFFFFAYQTVFYYCANKLGAWAPSDIPFTNDLNTRIPWMGVLFMGFFPAVSEEMQFRAFAVPFLAKFLRSMPAAIILAAFNWAFLHSAYPNEPFFIRGLEVGLGGILIGVVMLRFGIVATLIWHYSVDALYSAFLLLRSPNHYLMISGLATAGIMLLPLGVSLVAYLKIGSFEDDAELTNAAQGITRAVPTVPAGGAQVELGYQSLSRGRLKLVGILTALLAAVAFVPVYRFGEGIKVKMTAQEALRAADEYLRSQQIDPGKYHHSVRLLENVSSPAVRYLVEHVSVRKADQIYRAATQMLGWEVRYFRPLEVEERWVLFNPADGAFVDSRRSLDESAPGASLEEAQAQSMAEDALVAHGYRLSEFDLQSSTGEKRKARKDYRFVWQAKPGDARNVADEKYRVAVDIAGDTITGVSDWFNLPDEWQRQDEKSGLVNAVLSGCGVLLGLIIFTRVIILLVTQVRQGQIPWRRAAPVGAVLGVAVFLSELNGLPNIERSYNTSIPLGTFWLQAGIGLVLVPIMAALGLWLMVALAFSLFPNTQYLLHRRDVRPWRRDAALAVILSLAIIASISKVEAILTWFLPTYFPPQIDLAPGSLDTWSPAFAVFLSALSGAVSAAAVLALIIAIFRSGWTRRAWWMWAGCLLFLVSVGPASAHTVRQFLVVWIYGLASLAIVVWIVATFFRANPLAYLASIFCIIVAKPIVELLSQGARIYHANGLLLGVLSMIVLGWLLLPDRSALAGEQGISGMTEQI